MSRLIILTFFLLIGALFAKDIKVHEENNNINIVSNAFFYIDNSKELTIDEVRKKSFKPINSDSLSFGYAPDFHVWVKFTLVNTSNKKISKLLHYKNPLTSHVNFYDGNTIMKDGLFQISDRVTLTPTFKIELEANKKKTFYIKSYSYVTPLIIKLELLDEKEFQKSQTIHQIVLALFFGAMLVLAIYNSSIFIFTREVSYLYYVLYILGVIVHQLSYTGYGYIYLLNQQWTYEAFEYLSIVVGFPAFALALFTKSFLQINKHIWLCRILDLLVVILVVSVIFISLFDLDKYRGMVPLVLTLYLFFITLWSAIKRNKQAYFILFGWSVIIVAIVLLYLSSVGTFDIFNRFPYIVEVAFLSEAIIFSIALAYRIKSLESEKNEANQLLIKQQNTEKVRLQHQVEEKTSELQEALDGNEILLRELNHRVKNNMQTIISLIHLQRNDIEDVKLQEVLDTIKNRLNAMTYLHSYLYTGSVKKDIDAHVYFSNIISELQHTYKNHIRIHYDISVSLQCNDAVYCGLIINELVTNSYKYAFKNGEGNIFITLHKDKDLYILHVADDGCGYIKEDTTLSLGLNIVQALATLQLKGEIAIDSTNGVEVSIKWKGSES